MTREEADRFIHEHADQINALIASDDPTAKAFQSAYSIYYAHATVASATIALCALKAFAEAHPEIEVQ